MAAKTKIVLDADVIIHFSKADKLSFLLSIFPEYEYLLLDVVYEELTKHIKFKTQLDNTLHFFSNRISTVVFSPLGESRKDYAMLRATLGKGESACMVFCRDHHDVLGSSNLRDITDYCKRNGITYLTTIDFLYYAFLRKKMTEQECSDFINEVVAKGSKLPQVIISQHSPNAKL